MRTIKRYSNRKLYDTKESRYLTLSQLAGHVRAGDEVKVIEFTTGKDLTSATLAQVIFEEERRAPSIPAEALRRIILTGLSA